ncbi:hypothetical protein [Mycobacterium sp. D16R24]|uniref:hypothetical protein n=1 Tax=Mycobacterium sp. D16R24 TaxID=1855656 RepID=UPI000994183A|nr:hypothetical protein [Mycobacterium sp. D16R24]
MTGAIPAEKTWCHLQTKVALPPCQRGALAQLISPANTDNTDNTDNTSRTLSSIGLFVRRDLAIATIFQRTATLHLTASPEGVKRRPNTSIELMFEY